jgi:hypothetical protein
MGLGCHRGGVGGSFVGSARNRRFLGRLCCSPLAAWPLASSDFRVRFGLYRAAIPLSSLLLRNRQRVLARFMHIHRSGKEDRTTPRRAVINFVQGPQ